MAPGENLCNLRREIDRLQALLRETGEEALVETDLGLALVVKREKERSERYNHFFALVSFEFVPDGENGRLHEVRHCFRSTDMVGLLDGRPPQGDGDDGTCRIGVVMPETGRQGAATALSRALATMRMNTVRYGIAVYPDDAIDPDALVRLAAG